MGEDHDVEKVVEELVKKLKEERVSVDCFNIPQILVLTPETLTVTKLYKAIRDKYTKEDNVRVFKLFARHVAIKEHEKVLSAKPKGNVINVYIGTPNRVRALASCKAINVMSPDFKTLVFDC